VLLGPLRPAFAAPFAPTFAAAAAVSPPTPVTTLAAGLLPTILIARPTVLPSIAVARAGALIEALFALSALSAEAFILGEFLAIPVSVALTTSAPAIVPTASATAAASIVPTASATPVIPAATPTITTTAAALIEASLFLEALFSGGVSTAARSPLLCRRFKSGENIEGVAQQ
jgi:hypothetical protein